MVYYSTFSSYKSTTSWEANSINTNPLFVDAAKRDYRLASNSPCIDAGDPLSVKDANGTRSDIGALESVNSNTTSDTSLPIVSSFSIPVRATSLTIPLSSFTATDNIGVTGYLVNETAATPSISNSRWSSSVPTTYLALSTGTKTLYAWSKDGAGNVSASLTGGVTITNDLLPTDTQIIVKSLKIDVFPNPCIDNVTVRFSETPEPGSRIEIIDITGKNVASRAITNTEERISLSEQSSGLYMVKTIIGLQEKITKLIINK